MNRRAVGLATLYVAGSALSAVVAVDPTDLDAFFLPSAREALSGHPLHVYAVRHDTVYPNANGPLSLLPLTAVAAVASQLGWIDDPRLRRMLVMGVFSLISLLLAREAVHAVDDLRGTATRGSRRVLLYAAFAAPPLIWHSVLLYGHIEQPLCLWLVLLSVRAVAAGRMARAGVFAGLATLDRTVAILYAGALILLVLREQRRRAAPMLGAAAAVTVALGLAPFLLADGADTLFSLVTFRGALPVGGGSIWELTVGTRFEGWAQHLDSAAVIAVALIAAGGVRWRVRRRAPDRRTAYGILALVALCFPLLVKTVWPYYFLDCYVLAAVWSLGAPGGPGPRATALRVLLPAAISGCALLAELGVDAGSGPGLRRAESAAMFVILTAIALGLARALTRDYGTAVGIGGGVGAAGVVGAAEAAGTLGTGTPEGSGAPDGGGDTGADVGPSGGVGQLARATLKGVDDGLGEGEVPAGGVT